LDKDCDVCITLADFRVTERVLKREYHSTTLQPPAGEGDAMRKLESKEGWRE